MKRYNLLRGLNGFLKNNLARLLVGLIVFPIGNNCIWLSSCEASTPISFLYPLPYVRHGNITFYNAIAVQSSEKRNLFVYHTNGSPLVASCSESACSIALTWPYECGYGGAKDAYQWVTQPYILYMVECDQNNENCEDHFDGPICSSVGFSAPMCWDSEHVLTTDPIWWGGSYTGLCGVGDVAANSAFPANYVVPPSQLVTVTLNSVAVGSVTGPGIDCGPDCYEVYPEGTEVTLTATPEAGWKFASWVDGNEQLSSNPLTFTMDSRKRKIIAKFVPARARLAFKPYDDSPLEDRTPLVLVHDNNQESDRKGHYGWYKYINKIKNNEDLSNKYKIYTHRWNSNWSNINNGIAMGVLSDSFADLLDKEIVILAHGRGGLVSRYYMNEYRADSGKYKGKPAGEKVKRLVTLATPHRGSPLADDQWDTFSFDYNHMDASAFELCNFSDYLFKNTYRYLVWDDWDDELTNRRICWDSTEGCKGGNYCARFASNEKGILALNREEAFHNKILAVGGNRFEGKPTQLSILSKIVHGPYSWVTLPSNLKHNGLLQLSRMMAVMPIIPNDYTRKNPHIDDTYRPFKANDGMVPLVSSLFLGFGSGRIIDVDAGGNLTYDEAKIKEFCLAGSYFIVKKPVDHLDFLDDSDLVAEILEILKDL